MIERTKRTLACLTALALLLFLACPMGAFAASPATPQALQGSWIHQEGQNSMVFMFNGNACALSMNGMQMAGTWTLAGDQLRVQFQNGRTMTWRCFMDGPNMILDGSMRFTRQGGGGQQGGQPPYGGQQPSPGQPPYGGQQPFGGQQSPLEGTWVAQTPQGQLIFQFQGSRYVQYFNGQPVEEGNFVYYPDGRLQYQITGGQAAGQQGVNRIVFQGQSFSMYGANGNYITYQRQASQSQSQPPVTGPGATPLEGRWIWAKSSNQVSFGYVFSGNRFVYFMNGAQSSAGTFQLTQTQLVFQHDSGQTEAVGYQLSGNRLVVFPSDDPNIDPIPFVRQ